MIKYVQNIDRLFAGQTANALVLNQVDEDFPILIPALKEDGNIQSFVNKWRKIYPDFNPLTTTILDRDGLNQYIVDFNIGLQIKFKDKAHDELYMIDDTSILNSGQKTFDKHKIYIHSLNGKTEVQDGEDKTDLINLSQLNVLFPWKKLMNKSLYSS